ncbi:4Fe-4S ferredoxin [Sulfodiicoccus acidiphilus]|uniref:4Fe-4S ferredoxin n=1 Tax=Sulfodiicoccus acidiphilus TaxID=1670455 RepID=A0A348B6E6_9CREN|nr:4Fe-4S dicluster domain-containing protein [Sulfodiicoccus acidiphilus]BBD73748.1 4Fe-4S ferredoxin [Sulfodiicoccus acidiphilus]
MPDYQLPKDRLSFVFDHNKCILCGACVTACRDAYSWSEGVAWRKLPVFELAGLKTALSMSCNHCDNPTCMFACPAQAYTKDPKTGIVWIAQDKCIGCGYCTWACPYEVPQEEPDGTVSKCHFCRERLEGGKGIPYCVQACPTGALAFGWTKGGSTPDYLAPSDITRPNLVVVPPKEGKVEASPLKVKSEKNYWELVAFTILSEVGLFYALVSLYLHIPYGALVLALTFAAGLLPSVVHAKKSSRFLRVFLNLRSSWLSREVGFGGLTVLLASASILFQQLLPIAMAFSALSVASSIMVYMLKARPSWYDPDTPISFVGTGITVSLPVAAYLLDRYLFLVAVMFLALEIYTFQRRRGGLLRWSSSETTE